MKIKIIAISSIIALAMIFSGCVEEEAGIKTTLTEIRIGDMPTDEFDHINVTFSEVKLHSNETGWENYTIEDGEIDLIHLHLSNITEQLTMMELEVGNYTKLWLVIDSATGVLKGEDGEIELTVPSGTLKIQQLFKLVEGDNTITIDIDLNASILKYKGGEEYKILPVLGGISHHHNNKLKFQEQDKNKLKNMVENRKPVIDIEVNGNRTKHITVEVYENITLNASGTYDVDGDELTFEWDFGDGNSSVDPNVTHNYSKKGVYPVILTVSENYEGGFEETEKVTVTVK